MNDWFHIVEDSRYRRNALLAEANLSRRLAVLGGAGFREATAALLIKVAQWLAPATTPRRAVAPEERIVPQIARI